MISNKIFILNTNIKLLININNLSTSINKLNTIISTKLGVVIDADGSSDDSNKVAWEKAINILGEWSLPQMFIALLIYYLPHIGLNYQIQSID